MLIKPIGKKILLRVQPNQTIVKGELLIPVEKRYPEAEVLEIGDEVTEVAKGDRVLFEKGARNFQIVGNLVLANEDWIVLKFNLNSASCL